MWTTREIAPMITKYDGQTVTIEVDNVSGYTLTDVELVEIIGRGNPDGGADDLIRIRWSLPSGYRVDESHRVADIGPINGEMPHREPLPAMCW